MNRSTIGLVVLLASCCAFAERAAAREDGSTLLLAQAQQPAQGQPPPQPTPQERVAMLKQWLQASQMQLRSYEWIETTIVALDGEEKTRSQNTCYYGADGKVQKVPIANNAPPPSAPRGPLRKKVAENKKEELTDYMKSAVALVQSYVPPDPNRLQQAVNNGAFGMLMLEPGRRGQLQFGNYLKNGDRFSVDVELPTNRLLGMHVSSYLDTPEDAVQLDVTMGVLPDGTIYTSKTQLAAPAEDMVVTVENSGYRHK
jgi:hypothetical protein